MGGLVELGGSEVDVVYCDDDTIRLVSSRFDSRRVIVALADLGVDGVDRRVDFGSDIEVHAHGFLNGALVIVQEGIVVTEVLGLRRGEVSLKLGGDSAAEEPARFLDLV